MARRQSIESRRQLKALVTPAELRSTALNTGFLKRDRKLNLFNLLWSLTLGSDGPGPRKLTAIYQSYLFVASKRDTVHRSAFFKWLARPELADWLREVLDLVMCRLEEQGASADERLAGVLGQFREIYTTDSSILQLRESLEKLFPGARTNSSPAAMKIHVIQQVGGSGLRSVELTPGRTNDLKAFQPGPWLRGSLCINDLGYYDFWTFQRIEHFGGFFISRMKSNGNPRILRSHLKHRGRKVDIDGRKLKDVLPKLKRKTLDVEVEVTYTEKTTGARKPLRLRLVGIWDRADRCYHLYFTNVPPEVMKATDIANAYRLRWQVELLFRELKGVHQLDQLPARGHEGDGHRQRVQAEVAGGAPLPGTEGRPSARPTSQREALDGRGTRVRVTLGGDGHAPAARCNPSSPRPDRSRAALREGGTNHPPSSADAAEGADPSGTFGAPPGHDRGGLAPDPRRDHQDPPP